MQDAEEGSSQAQQTQEEVPTSSTEESAPQETSAKSKQSRSGGSFAFLPHHRSKSTNVPQDAFLGSYGNAAGDKIQSGLSPIGKPMGKGFEMIGRPLGGLVEPLVGGLMKTAGAFGDAAGVGAGNMDHKRAAEAEERKEPVGGKEQTAGNPLGLWKEEGES